MLRQGVQDVGKCADWGLLSCLLRSRSLPGRVLQFLLLVITLTSFDVIT